MLHIIFAILKIVLLILAAVLGVVLLLLALLLFVPVRYEAQIKKKEKFFVEAKVHWLFHLVRVPVSFRDGELSAKLKVLIFTVKEFLADEEEIEDGVKDVFADAEEDAGKAAEQVEKDPVRSSGQSSDDKADSFSEKMNRKEKVEQKKDETGQVTDSNRKQMLAVQDKTEFSEEETHIGPGGEKTEGTGMEPAREQRNPFGFFKEITDFLKMLVGFLKSIWHCLTSIPKKLKNLKYTFHRFCVKIKRLKRFAADDRTKAALGLAWSQLKVLLGKLLPKKLWGDLHFGTDDPALTGVILGGISIFYPLFMDKGKVVPDFQEAVLEGELYLKGRIRLMTIARIAWKLYRDKNVQFVYRMVT